MSRFARSKVRPRVRSSCQSSKADFERKKLNGSAGPPLPQLVLKISAIGSPIRRAPYSCSFLAMTIVVLLCSAEYPVGVLVSDLPRTLEVVQIGVTLRFPTSRSTCADEFDQSTGLSPVVKRGSNPEES